MIIGQLQGLFKANIAHKKLLRALTINWYMTGRFIFANIWLNKFRKSPFSWDYVVRAICYRYAYEQIYDLHEHEKMYHI